jgi:tetratricopeptide (TPR) repeat protein
MRACVIVVALTLTGCAARHRPGAVMRPEGLDTYIRKVRAASTAARPPTSGVLTRTLETWDPELAAALAVLAGAPTAENHRRVAQEYRRVHVLDMAHAHLTAAVGLDGSDAAAYDGLARVWRDFGFPALGLGDAYRAVYLAPASPAAENTLGTLLQATGHVREARDRYSRALQLDPQASYALNNLCYASVMLGEQAAVAACERARMLLPGSRVAGNNLALAHAAAGDAAGAHAAFEVLGGPAGAAFNMGIVYLAQRQYAQASDAFDRALVLNPRFAPASARAREARLALAREP